MLVGYSADLLVGDPSRWHPVAGFGQVAGAVERRVWAASRGRGVVFALGLVGGAAALAEFLGRLAPRRLVFAAVIWAALGGRSLRREARRVANFLEGGDLERARGALRSLCGRDAAALDGAELCRATVESVAENTSDAVVGALLWGAVFGPGGVAGYRAANTLDAMVGHRSERYREFGWAAARLDDALSWPAARVSAALAALCAPVAGGSVRAAVRIARRDGARHPSPNAGRVEAAFAGALGVRVGGPLAYAGESEVRPYLGDGPGPGVADIRRSCRLSAAVGAAAALLAAAVGRPDVELRRLFTKFDIASRRPPR